MRELRRKILFTLAMLVVIRLGSQLPVPGVDRSYFANWFAAQTGDAFNFFDAFTGGSFENMSLFALNITPYITSSIIIQLLTIAIPKLEEMQKDGEEGRKKLTAITRYVTVGLALIQSAAMAIGFGGSGLLEEYNALNVITVIAALTAGGIIAPLIPITGASPELMVLAVGAGSVILSPPSDPGFWLFKEFFGLTVKGTMRTWCALETIIAVAGLIGVMILNTILF